MPEFEYRRRNSDNLVLFLGPVVNSAIWPLRTSFYLIFRAHCPLYYHCHCHGRQSSRLAARTTRTSNIIFVTLKKRQLRGDHQHGRCHIGVETPPAKRNVELLGCFSPSYKLQPTFHLPPGVQYHPRCDKRPTTFCSLDSAATTSKPEASR